MPMVGDRPAIDVSSIVFATDFSACSENAGSYARLLANYFSAPLLVAHAFLLSRAAHEVELRHGTSSQHREELKARLSHVADTLGSTSVKTEPFLLEGNPHEVIPTLADKHEPSLIVLGTHGAGPIEHGVIGSVAEKILRSSRWPCFTVGPKVPPIAPGTPPFRRILFTTDFTTAGTHAAPFALAFAEEAGGEIDTLNVIPDHSKNDADKLSLMLDPYYDTLARLVPPHARDFCSPHTFVEEGNAHDRIIGHIREHKIDLLVLGLLKSSHLGLEMRTSGAFRLIADAECPVLTVTG